MPSRPLTTREVDILNLAGRGLTNVAIANRLFLSPETVKAEMRRACRSLGAADRTHAVALALAAGLIPPDPTASGGTPA